MRALKLFATGLAALATITAVVPAFADKPAAPAAPAEKAADFTDSSAAGLAGTKRVAITSVVVAFQASAGAMKGPHPFFRAFQSKDEVLAVLAMPNMSADLQDALAASAYQQLQKSLTEAGFEVVPEAQVKASTNYQAILKQAGYTNHSRFANMLGDVTLVGPASLQPYMAYSGETGPFNTKLKTYLGWISAFVGKSSTPGGPSTITMGEAWRVPALEVALAKELNAHVVKATYIVSLGTTTAQRSTSTNYAFNAGFDMLGNSVDRVTRTTTGNAKAYAQVGLVPDQSRIAFRTPGGNAKWQKVSMTNAAPAKDGDVVVRLNQPLVGSTDFFSLTRQSAVQKSGGMFGGLANFGSAKTTGDLNINDYAQITDETRYGREVADMIRVADNLMLDLVRR